MKTHRLPGRLASAAMVLGMLALGSGCATSRDAMRLDIPEAPAAAASTGKTVYIRSVKDARRFEDNPSDPSVPSLGHGGVGAVSAAERTRAIARKRNTYGKALGDIFLEEGQTVETVVADTLKSAYRGMGYTVADSGSGLPRDAVVLDVKVDRFWAWMKPGFAALTLTADVAATIDISSSGRSARKTVTGQGEKKAQTGVLSNWREAFSRALASFRDDAMSKLK